MTATKTAAMRAQYAAWPYPQVPLLASLPSTHPFELHVDWLWDRSGSGPAPARPRVWIAGCGTFQPYAFAVANPTAEIVATDLSEPSLAIARRRCRLHRQPQVQFAAADLGDPGTWPAGCFDLIECYGVLMNLADPLAALRGLRERLTPGGVLRVMVYPEWSRARVFQLQRLARLLGLHAGERHHPALFRKLVLALPPEHPLRHAFTHYADSRNDAGVVDGFLHAGDRGFTAFQLTELVHAAGLQPAYWFHRPWAQPDRMAERLGLQDTSQAFVLNYLDLWQELRGNFVVCLRAADAPPRQVQPARPHPVFAGTDATWRHRLRLQRLRWFGGRVPTRTGFGDVVLRPVQARAVAGGRADEGSPLALGGVDHGPRLPAHGTFAGEAGFLRGAAALRLGRRAPNPLYAHLFAAWELAARHPELGLPDLEAQIGRWLPWADPLEQRPLRFGLTPYGTFLRFRVNVTEHLAQGQLPTAPDWSAVRLRHDAAQRERVRAFVAAWPDLPQQALADHTQRELAVLLFGHDSLFLGIE
jgi:SAM-dependent methyltransferase